MSTITYYLDMQHEQICAKPLPTDLSVVECQLKQFRLNRFLYQLVGESPGSGPTNSAGPTRHCASVQLNCRPGARRPTGKKRLS